MTSEAPSQVLRQKGRGKRAKIRTVIVEDGDIVFIEYPLYRLPTIQILGSKIASIRLLPLDK